MYGYLTDNILLLEKERIMAYLLSDYDNTIIKLF
jgi:hypothetical protein